MGAVRALDLSQNHPSYSWRQEGLRAPESSGKGSGERRLSPGGWGGRMGSSLISHFNAQRPTSPPPHAAHRPVPSSLKVHRTFTDTAIENGRRSTVGEALFYEFAGKQPRVTDEETGIQVVTCMAPDP